MVPARLKYWWIRVKPKQVSEDVDIGQIELKCRFYAMHAIRRSRTSPPRQGQSRVVSGCAPGHRGVHVLTRQWPGRLSSGASSETCATQT
eukprot:6205634-Pleurochrysis_carterae.AAC.3